jgi:hypothetical protein
MILIFNRVSLQLDPREAGEKSTGIKHRSLVQGLEHHDGSVLPLQDSSGSHGSTGEGTCCKGRIREEKVNIRRTEPINILDLIKHTNS